MGFGAVASPYMFGAKASLNDVIGVFCTVIIPDCYGWGVDGHKIRAIGKPRNHLTYMIATSLTANIPLAVHFYCNKKQKDNS